MATLLRWYISVKQENFWIIKLAQTTKIFNLLLESLKTKKVMQNESLLIEILWNLSNLFLIEENVAYFFKQDFLVIFFGLFQLKNLKIIRNTLWGLANISGTGPNQVKFLEKRGVIKHIKNILMAFPKDQEIIETISWITCNLCRFSKS